MQLGSPWTFFVTPKFVLICNMIMKMFRENQTLPNHPTLALRFEEDFFINWVTNAADSKLKFISFELERETRFELATSTLARLRSTN